MHYSISIFLIQSTAAINAQEMKGFQHCCTISRNLRAADYQLDTWKLNLMKIK